MTLPLPRIHASDPTFSSGPASGSDTKTDPGAALAAQGIIPGAAYLAQHENYERNLLTRHVRRQWLQALTFCRRKTATVATPTSDGVALADTDQENLLIIKAGASGVVRVPYGGDDLDAFGTVSTLTNITAIAQSPSRIIVFGSPSPYCSFTTSGATWTDGGVAATSTPSFAVWSSANSGRFLCMATGVAAVNYSADGTAWTAVNPGLAVRSLANLGSAVVAMGVTAGAWDFRRSVDGGTSWNTTGWTLPNNAGATYPQGALASSGDGSARLYHVGTLNDQTFQVSVSTGSHFTKLADLTYDGVLDLSANGPQIRVCPDTGVIVVSARVADVHAQQLVWVSCDEGASWSSAIPIGGSNSTRLDLRQGRLVTTQGDGAILLSDGIKEFA